MTNRHKNSSQLNVGDNAECNCLPSHHNKHQFFLSKNRILEPSQKHPAFAKNNEESSCGSIKMASLKKSLRKVKGNPFRSPPNKRSSNAYQEYYSPSRALYKEETQDKPILKYKEAEIKNFGPRISFNINRSGQYLGQTSPGLKKMVSCQKLQSIHHNVRQTMHVPLHFSPPAIQPIQPISPKVYFRHEYSPPPVRHPDFSFRAVNTPPLKFKTQHKIRPQVSEEIRSQLLIQIPEMKAKETFDLKSEKSFLSNKSDNGSEVQKRRDQVVNKPIQKISLVKSSTSIIKPCVKYDQLHASQDHADSFRSKIPMKKSSLVKQAARSKIMLNNIRESKPHLKKISDVEQIHSVIDSDEMSNDDDKQSVVLGRLREYGSFVDPFSSNIPSLRSKGGYQSTTAEKSHLRNFDANFR